MSHYVYKYVHEGEIVYIGKCDAILKNRIYQHRLEDKFKPYANADIYYTELVNATMSDVVESELIRRYKPKLNVAKMSDWAGIEFAEPKWKKYIPEDKGDAVNKEKSTKRHVYTSKWKIAEVQEKIKTYELMAEYYCPKILENIPYAKETETDIEIAVPISPEGEAYISLPYMRTLPGEKHFHGLSLSHSGYIDDDETFVFCFSKDTLFTEFENIEPGIIPRILYAQKIAKIRAEEARQTIPMGLI